jgi:FkbM family methyltransferase
MKIERLVKSAARMAIDSLYCRPVADKRKIGTIDNWYILTKHLQNAIVYSGGVGKDITFEMAVAREFNAQIFLFDPSPTGISTIQTLKLPSNIRFYPLGLAGNDGALVFATPLKSQEGSFRVGEDGPLRFECRKLSTLLRENKHTSVELLKIDIEGFEYDVIDDIVNNGLNIHQIAVEFHDFYPDVGKEKTLRAIRLLKSCGYTLFHKRGHDYSFIKKND